MRRQFPLIDVRPGRGHELVQAEQWWWANPGWQTICLSSAIQIGSPRFKSR
jgi:hypothetical protein